MPLVDDILRLREQSLAALDASHDFHVHTKSAWRILQRVVQKGHSVLVHNRVTGTSVDGAELAGLAQDYVRGFLASATFQHFVSLFERFAFDLLQAWLLEYPASLGRKEIRFEVVLDAVDRDAIVAAVVQREVHTLAYQRVSEWFARFERIANLGCPDAESIERLAEVKASRDVLVHGNGIANATYVEKSMGRARHAEGEPLELTERYHRESWLLIRQVVLDMSGAALAKLGY